MKKFLPLLIAVTLIVLAGCSINEEENVSPSEMNAEDLPNVP